MGCSCDVTASCADDWAKGTAAAAPTVTDPSSSSGGALDSEPSGLQSQSEAPQNSASSSDLRRGTLPGELPPPPQNMDVSAKPQLFFLFLVYVSIVNEDIWSLPMNASFFDA